jgi:hypothetical protein
VFLAAVLDGGYWYLRSSLTGGLSGSTTIWIGLILALILAIAITWFLSNAVRRELAKASGGSTSATTATPTTGDAQ